MSVSVYVCVCVCVYTQWERTENNSASGVGALLHLVTPLKGVCAEQSPTASHGQEVSVPSCGGKKKRILAFYKFKVLLLGQFHSEQKPGKQLFHGLDSMPAIYPYPLQRTGTTKKDT